MSPNPPSDTSFHLFTSLRYDPLLLRCPSNSSPTLNFTTPSPFYMLVYHRDRMLEAAQHFDFHAVASYLSDGVKLHQTLLDRVWEWIKSEGRLREDGPLKLRLLFDREGKLEVEIGPLPKVPLSTLYPGSLDPPPPAPERHPANTASAPAVHPLTGGVLTLGPTDSIPSSDSSKSTSPPSPSSSPSWVLKLDTSPTPSTPFTLLKTTHRSFYDQSRARALPVNEANPMLSEVMLYNEVLEMTEGSMTSLYFFRGGRWITPPVGVPAGEFNSSTLRSNEPRSELEGGTDAEMGVAEGNGEADLKASRQDEGELRKPFLGRWGHSVRSAKVGAGGQRGTTRRWALGQGMCMEEPVSVDTVEVGEGVWVSNGVRGFGFGRVVA